MQPINRVSTPMDPYATGVITPMGRVMGHLGYAMRVVEKADEEWAEEANEVVSELVECQNHLLEMTDASAFVSQGVIDLAYQVKTDIANMRIAVGEASMEKEDVATSLANIAHNAAWVIACMERDLCGNNATDGALL